MYQRVTSEKKPMPPTGPGLSAQEIEIVRTWTREGAPEGDPPYTWYRDVRPIVIANCLRCHSDPPRMNAPIPLVMWEQTQADRGGRRVHQVMAARVDDQLRPMPPAPATRLSIGEINLIRAWSRIGGPKGDPSDVPDGGVPDVGMPNTTNPLGGVGSFDLIQSGYTMLDGADWNEPENVLVFADPGGDTVYELTPPNTLSMLRTPSGRTAGVRYDQNDRLISAEQESRTITRTDDQGAIQTIAENFGGTAFQAPRDLAVRLTDGTIYFTDPALGVFRVAPNGTVGRDWQVLDETSANGLELSPDERTLYVSDARNALLRAFDVEIGGALANERVLAYTEPEPEGIAPDQDGNLFVATRTGVQAFASNGWSWGVIPTPERPVNVAFGGADRRTLYVTTATSLYAIAVQIAGTRWSRGNPDAGANPLEGVGPAEGFGPMTYQFLEGPDWDRANGRLVYSDIPASTIYQYVPPDAFSPLLMPSAMANGLFVEPSGSILVCEHEGRRVSRLNPDMTVANVADQFEGMLLNSPNDVIRRSDGTIYFTDPDYGLVGRPRELNFHGVFRLTPQGALTAEWRAALNERPNGIAFSPDESVLYVTDTEQRRVMRFDVAGDGALTGMGLFANAMGTLPDGLTIDRDGNVYLASSAGIEVYRPDGTAWGTIPVAEAPSNVTFGGPELRTLYITTAHRLYRVDVPIAAP
jgi:gluconolactonase